MKSTRDDSKAPTRSVFAELQKAHVMPHDEISGSRWDMYCAVPSTARSILDIGCGVGLSFLPYRERGVRLVGVDIDAESVAQAQARLDEALVLDIESQPWPEHFLRAFDVVAFCDCLEHLIDPWSVLRRVQPLLSPNGVVVASIPNIRQVRLIIKLMLGRFDYLPNWGTINRSHLRFFTRKTITDMFLEAGYQRPTYFYPRKTFHLKSPERLLNALTMGGCADLLYGSYTVSARPASPRQSVA